MIEGPKNVRVGGVRALGARNTISVNENRGAEANILTPRSRRGCLND